MCSECGKRQVLVRVKGGKNKKLPAKMRHDLCRQCWFSILARCAVEDARDRQLESQTPCMVD